MTIFSEGVLIALFTAVASVIAQFIAKSARDAKLDEQLTQIKDRLDTHNHYAERIGAIEDSLLLIGQDVKYIKEGKFK